MPDDSSPLLAPHALPRCPTSARSPRRFPARRPATTRWPNSSAASVRACCRHCRKLLAAPLGRSRLRHRLFQPGPGTTLRCGRGPSRGYRRRHAAACPRARRRQPFHRRRRREAAVARRQLRPAVLQPGHPVVRRPPGGPGRGAAVLRSGGVLAFSSLCVGTLGELRDSWRVVDASSTSIASAPSPTTCNTRPAAACCR